MEHLDPHEQMAHLGDIDIGPLGTRAVGKTGDIDECAALAGAGSALIPTSSGVSMQASRTRSPVVVVQVSPS